jgi:hypothetical protein
MMLALKIIGMWTIVSIASGLVIAPMFARRLRGVEPAETETSESWFQRHKFRRWA